MLYTINKLKKDQQRGCETVEVSDTVEKCPTKYNTTQSQ